MSPKITPILTLTLLLQGGLPWMVRAILAGEVVPAVQVMELVYGSVDVMVPLVIVHA